MNTIFDHRHVTRTQWRRRVITRLAMILTLSTAGCGGGSTPVPIPLKDQIVTGKAMLAGGKPLTRGRVALFPLQEPYMQLYGSLKPDGSFTLGAAGIGTNVSLGDFQVSIEPPGYSPGSKPPRALGFPAKYLNETTSGLKVTITPETKELPTFELK